MKQLLVLLTLGLVFAACSPEKKYAEEIKEIEGYQTAIDSIVEIYNSIKFDSLIYIQKSASDFEDIVKNYYMADTMSMALAERLRNMKSIRKSLGHIKDEQKILAKEGRVLKKQLETLKADIINGVYSRGQINEYMDSERKAFASLTDNIDMMVKNEARQLNDYNYAYPMVKEYTDLIKPKEDQD